MSNGSLLWSSYLGGNNWESIEEILLDNQENIIVLGWTHSYNFPTKNAANSTYGGNGDLFISKIDSKGVLQWSSYHGGNDREELREILFDSKGNILISGSTWSSDFPTINGINNTMNGNEDIFLSKFADDGSLLWSTVLGGSEWDGVYSTLLDSHENVLIVGETYSSDFPTKDGLNEIYGGNRDLFITKLTSEGSLLWSTYFGGSEEDQIRSVSIDNQNNTLIVGVFGDDRDIFICKFGPDGSLLWSTYLVGNDWEEVDETILDQKNNIFLIGGTTSSDFPVKNAFKSSNGDNEDLFISKIGSNGTLLWSTYLGGSDREEGPTAFVDNFSNLYIFGETQSHDFPTYDLSDTVNNEQEESQNNLSWTNIFSSRTFFAMFNSNGRLLLSTFLVGGDQNIEDIIEDPVKNQIMLFGTTKVYRNYNDVNPLIPGQYLFVTTLLDRDEDSLFDVFEKIIGTDMLIDDTDGDGMPDGWEFENGLDPRLADGNRDPDDDNLSNLKEYLYGTDPHNTDTDGDGMTDGWEVRYGLNPLVDDADGDLDKDFILNKDEFKIGSIPNNPFDVVLFVTVVVTGFSMISYNIYKKIKWRRVLKERKKNQEISSIHVSYPENE
jgi:hypothetical protein